MRALPITLCSTLRSPFARWRCRSASAPDLATGGDAGGRLAGAVGGTGRNHCGPGHEPSGLASIVTGGFGSSGPGRGAPRERGLIHRGALAIFGYFLRTVVDLFTDLPRIFG